MALFCAKIRKYKVAGWGKKPKRSKLPQKFQDYVLDQRNFCTYFRKVLMSNLKTKKEKKVITINI